MNDSLHLSKGEMMSKGLIKGYAIIEATPDGGPWYLSRYIDQDNDHSAWTPDDSTAYIFVSKDTAKRAARDSFGLEKGSYKITMIYRKDMRDDKSPKQFGFTTVADSAS